MKHVRFSPWIVPAVLVPLLLVITFAPTYLQAQQHNRVADFQPPVSLREAQAIITAARQAQQNEQLDRTTSAIPFVQTFFVAETGYHLSDRAGFLNFWRQHGGALVFGYPIGEELVEDGRIVQYFERARFEFHPENSDPNYQVQLSLLGRELTQDRIFEPVTPHSGEYFFPETGFGVSGPFLQFWKKRGGLPIFGYPISAPIEEVNPIDGQIYTVQYFERARFEHHPNDMPGFYRSNADTLGLRLLSLNEVRLTNLGQYVAARRGYAFVSHKPFGDAPQLTSQGEQRYITVNLSTQRLIAYEGNIPVFSAPVTTGKDGFNTPTGTFAIYTKLPMQTMRGNAGGEEWYVPDVPWVQYIVGGVALHGTYWHDRFGTGVRSSHGCINLNLDDAQWLYEWADIGTEVTISY